MNEAEEAARQQEKSRGQRAVSLAEDMLFKEAVEAVRKDCWREFEKSKIDDDRARLVARLKIDLLEDILGKLFNHIRTGRLAAEQLSRWEKLKETMKRKTA